MSSVEWQWKSRSDRWIKYSDQMCNKLDQLNIGQSETFVDDNSNENEKTQYNS